MTIRVLLYLKLVGIMPPCRGGHETFQAETRRDRDRDVTAPETLAETYGENH